MDPPDDLYGPQSPLESPRYLLWQRAAQSVMEEHPYEMIAAALLTLIFFAAVIPQLPLRRRPLNLADSTEDHIDLTDRSSASLSDNGSEYADTQEVKAEQHSEDEASSSSGLYSIPAMQHTKTSEKLRYRVITPAQDPTWLGFHSPPTTSSPPSTKNTPVEPTKHLKTPRVVRTHQGGLQPTTPAPHARKSHTPMRMESVSVETRKSSGHTPYISVDTHAPIPLAPGDLVLRPRPAKFVHPGTVDDDVYDGPFIVLSCSNPAPRHLASVPGAALASWAELELPENATAERWYMEHTLVKYEGEITAARLRRYACPVDDRYVMDKIRNERITNRGKKEYKISWKGYPCEDDTWEPARKVLNVDPELIEEYEDSKKY